tara:strand:+ start:232 stop:1371 length:1140 start_codon:yes stop_codon:yes gene_type:complete
MKKLAEKHPDKVEIRFDDNPLGVDDDLKRTPEDFTYENMKWADVVFTHNIHSRGGQYTINILAQADKLGKFTHYDTDDLLTDLYTGHRLYDVYKEQKLDDYTKAIYYNADLVSVTQKKFAERVKPFVRKALVVIKNAIDFELPCWNLQWQPPPNKKLTRVGWVGGIHHEEDVKEFKSVVLGMNSKVGVENLRWTFHGRPPLQKGAKKDWQQDVWDNYERMLMHGVHKRQRQNIYFGHAMNGNEYGAFYRDMDVSIAPLQMNNFNDSKSDIKLMECGRYGVPLVASDIGCYNETIIDGVTGFLIPEDNPRKVWIEKLAILAKNPKLRREMGENLRQQVNEKFDINKHVGERYHLYKQLMEFKRQAMEQRTKENEQSNSNN